MKVYVSELLFHVDERDNVLGSIDRDEAHRTESLHRSGMVFLVNSTDKVLVHHRSPSKATFPDCWDASSTFHVTYGETYEVAAERELFEELGVTDPVEFIGKFVHHDSPEYQIVAVFVCKSDQEIVMDRNEMVEIKFLSKQNVENVLSSEKVTPWFRGGWKIFGEHLNSRKD